MRDRVCERMLQEGACLNPERIPPEVLMSVHSPRGKALTPEDPGLRATANLLSAIGPTKGEVERLAGHAGQFGTKVAVVP